MYDEPSQKEQDIAWEYCCKRTLERPDTDISKAVKYTVIFLLGVIICSVVLYWLCIKLNPPGSFFERAGFIIAHPFVTKVVVFLFTLLLSLCFCSKLIVIGFVKLYQHYAPEDVRRRCLLKPTCSEYMIMAVQKYGVIKGVYKGIYRLLYVCRGTIFRIDYP